MTTTTADDILRPEPEELKFDYKKVIAHPAFYPVVILIAGLMIGFWHFLKGLPQIWTDKTTEYYSHGPLVPFMTGFIIWKAWPRIREYPVKRCWPAVIPLVLALFLYSAGVGVEWAPLLSVAFVLAAFSAAWILLGTKWAGALAVPVGYLIFMTPFIPESWIDRGTNILQQYSARIAVAMLDLTGFDPLPDINDPTTVYLGNFVMNVGVACSGLKTIIAVIAFTVFFVAIARLNFWANMIMFVSMLPIALFINGLRIAMIGVVGDYYGSDAGMKFHDYSGYIALVICFVIIFKIARWLGWKD